ncbi:MAG: HAD family hydrolase [Methanosphaera stadtmanae]|nr:HAD family hydrolase [Methanosphaera stadtmanae]
MKRLFIFDLDGMILDTIEDSFTCVNQVLKEFGIKPYEVDLKTMHYPSFRKYLNDNDAGKQTPVYPRYIEVYANHPLDNTKPFAGMIEVLTELQNRGVILAICTNRDEKVVKGLVKRFFDGINFKYISGYKKGVPDKPNPYRLNEIINAEGIEKSEVIYFGDKDADIQVARNALIDMIIVTYGQGSQEDYDNPYPLRVINKPEDILELIDEGIIAI